MSESTATDTIQEFPARSSRDTLEERPVTGTWMNGVALFRLPWSCARLYRASSPASVEVVSAIAAGPR